MKTADFVYDLPPELIAQTPIEPRDASRLLRLDRSTGALEHRRFNELPDLLQPGDLLVANESRVIPARILAHKAKSGGAIEILLLRQLNDVTWQALLRGHRLRTGLSIEVTSDLNAEIVEHTATGEFVIRFNRPIGDQLDRVGVMPLPPYIHARLDDPDRYQTVYSHIPGSAAAPTAGLHFTPALIDRLKVREIEMLYVTLHVGLDTFKPVETEDVEQHHIHSEYMQFDQDTATQIQQAKQSGRRIIAVGTTAVRVLESAARHNFQAFTGDTNLFIYPGFEFRAIDGLITNFHLPRSSLLMLVSAFAGKDKIDRAYTEAVAQCYRFFSFGDAMLIL
jgi:S-adenosylmethionine:tRNA ribosyltransferase-isomerase